MNAQSCLLVDNSNTRTKFMLCSGESAPELRILYTAEISHDSVGAVLEGWRFERACLCSVVPWAAQILSEVLGGIELVQLNTASAKGVDFSTYPGADTLGADRVANVMAAVRHATLPLVAVDMGTATTLDVVVQGGNGPVFAGGLIAPGLSAVAECLNQRTAMLPVAEYQTPGPVVGRNTREAMAAAVRVGYPGMLDSLLSAVESELGEQVQVVLTGGDAQELAPALHHRGKLVPSLTLEGLALALDVQL